MRSEWKKARLACERVEGSIAVLFPEFDESTDQRYDGLLENATDTNLFDDEVVTGVPRRRPRSPARCRGASRAARSFEAAAAGEEELSARWHVAQNPFWKYALARDRDGGA